jgi:hypothetical protein
MSPSPSGWKKRQEIIQHEAGENQITCYLFHAGFLLGLFFDSEDGSNTFLRNIDRLSTDHKA